MMQREDILPMLPRRPCCMQLENESLQRQQISDLGVGRLCTV